ncbi:N-acetylmannosamine-6-phosphate 2-epimerase, partial [Tropicimonas isoalkanivorans]
RVPIIGIVKRDLSDSPVRITVTVEDARALIAAGADIVAYDATARPRTDRREDIVAAILDGGAIAMADCSTFEDAQAAIAEGAGIIGTTLSGYTEETATGDDRPDFDLIRRFRDLDSFVMAEGRFNTPELAAGAIASGADAVTVGSALTRLEIVTGWFTEAVRGHDD